ncbi:Uncharacterized protein APZ42_018175 [Daphnia magna]|uniref:Uncharacterized protein n=1 Tax=Daphnia magna TaxID=35525 RepID=A0A0P4Y569_9CRUS|nr:Uncharacterized protein APZ42_018175 [Daphnia magna]
MVPKLWLSCIRHFFSLLLNYKCKPYAEKVIRVGQVTAEFVCNRITVDRDTIRVFRRIAV